MAMVAGKYVSIKFYANAFRIQYMGHYVVSLKRIP